MTELEDVLAAQVASLSRQRDALLQEVEEARVFIARIGVTPEEAQAQATRLERRVEDVRKGRTPTE